MKLATIFDLDGTLIDTPRGIVETFIAALRSMDIEFNDAAAIRATIGTPLEKAFAGLLGVDSDSEKVAHAVKQYQLLFKEIVLPKAKELVFPGVESGLKILKSQGYLLAVATSKVFKSAEALLKAAGLWDYFDLVVGADHVKQPKPNPEMGLLVLRELGVLATQSIMVGDTTHDILMAHSAGIRSIGVTYGIHDLQTLKSANPIWVANTFDGVMYCIDEFAAAPVAV